MRSDPPEELLGQLRQAGGGGAVLPRRPGWGHTGQRRALELLLKGLGWRTSIVADGQLPAGWAFCPG